jgi:hypothetical protein
VADASYTAKSVFQFRRTAGVSLMVGVVQTFEHQHMTRVYKVVLCKAQQKEELRVMVDECEREIQEGLSAAGFGGRLQMITVDGGIYHSLVEGDLAPTTAMQVRIGGCLHPLMNIYCD